MLVHPWGCCSQVTGLLDLCAGTKSQMTACTGIRCYLGQYHPVQICGLQTYKGQILGVWKDWGKTIRWLSSLLWGKSKSLSLPDPAGLVGMQSDFLDLICCDSPLTHFVSTCLFAVPKLTLHAAVLELLQLLFSRPGLFFSRCSFTLFPSPLGLCFDVTFSGDPSWPLYLK